MAKLADLGLVKEVETDLNLTRPAAAWARRTSWPRSSSATPRTPTSAATSTRLGATLYMMVTGELPFKSNGPLDAWMKKIHNELTPPRQLVPDLSERRRLGDPAGDERRPGPAAGDRAASSSRT